MFQPMLAALARELDAVGLTGRAAAPAIRGLQFHVVASVVMERTAARGPTTPVTDPTAWPELTDDRELIEALAGPVDYDAVFTVGLEALLDRFLR
jgi:TetR/AcrR family transcriptional regulator, tetracycline repressor protein